MPKKFRCRTCGQRTNRLKSKHLFENDDNIVKKIEILTSIRLTDEFNVPGIICLICISNLNHAIEFRTRCIKVNQVFMLASSKKVSLDDPLSNDGNGLKLEGAEYATELRLNHNLPYKVVKAQKASKCSPSFYSCDLCDVRFTHETSLSRHRKEDCSSLLVVEEQCERNLNLTDQSLPEKSNHSKTSEQSQQSDTSSKPRINVSSTSTKTKKSRNFFCDQCGRHFNDNANFNRHVQRHLGVKRFKCEECEYKDYSQHLINLHTRIQHRGEQPYACKYCDKRFINSMARLRHQRSHEEHLETQNKVATFTCALCGKNFVNKSTLDKHAIVHTGEQPFYCEICCIYFNRKSSLQTHYRSKTHQYKATSKLDETGVDSD